MISSTIKFQSSITGQSYDTLEDAVKAELEANPLTDRQQKHIAAFNTLYTSFKHERALLSKRYASRAAKCISMLVHLRLPDEELKKLCKKYDEICLYNKEEESNERTSCV